MTDSQPIVYLVDDDPGMTTALARLLRAEGIESTVYGDPEDFLAEARPPRVACVVLDLSMPRVDGLSVQRALASQGIALPIVFLTGRGDVASSVRAMKDGAIDFLSKPVDANELISAIHTAFERSRAMLQLDRERLEVDRRLSSLTPREREVMRYVLSGRLNKQIAAELGTAEKTVKVHRARVMQKMGVRSVAELTRACGHAGIEPAPGHR